MNKKGFTLVELIIVIMMSSVIMLGVGSFLTMSIDASRQAVNEAEFQSQMRVTSDRINNTIRNATVTFAIPQSAYDNKVDMWNYIGLEKNPTTGKNEIVNYIWNDVTNQRDRHLVTEISDQINLSLFFNQKTRDSNLIEFNISGENKQFSEKVVHIKSELAAMNSLVVEDGGTPGKPAIALAYRTDPTPTPENKSTKMNVAIAFVLDTSGSMGSKMGGNGPDRNKIRLDIMQQKTNELIDKFASMGNINVSLIPYSSQGLPQSIVLASDNAVALKKAVNNLKANGGTNTGDAMRRAYYVLENYRATHSGSGNKVMTYMIVLTDGNPTYYTYYTQNWTNYYYFGDLPINNAIKRGGSGAEEFSNLNDSLNYIKGLGNELFKNTSKPMDVKSAIIAFSGVTADLDRVKTSAEYLNSPGNPERESKFYKAENSDELSVVYEDITNIILNDTWHIFGPYENQK